MIDNWFWCVFFQNENGRFEVFLEKDGQPFNVFDVVPTPILNEANLLIRVKDSSALDYEVVQTFTFEVGAFRVR